jgi:hypothetical protein
MAEQEEQREQSIKADLSKLQLTMLADVENPLVQQRGRHLS